MTSTLFDMTGKTAYITGGTKGIGRAIANAFVDHGAAIVLTGRSLEEAERVAADINAGVKREVAFGSAADLADRTKLIASYDSAVRKLGRIDVLVCNAAAHPSTFGPAATNAPEEYSRLMEWNVVNNAALINHAAVAMKERRDGVILVTSSSSGIDPAYSVLPYGTSKAGLSFFVRGLAGELASYNVRINAIAPGLTLSDKLQERIRDNPELVDGMLRQVPLRRFIAPQEIAAGMVFLASEGGKAITGKTIVMEAGEQGPGVGPISDA